MSDYNSGYDEKYGYNRNAFAHKTLGTAIMGRVVKIIVTPIGLVSEAVHAHKDKGRSSSTATTQEAGSNSSALEDGSSRKTTAASEGPMESTDAAYVDVPPEMADQLIASGQAEPTDKQAPTQELVVDDDGQDGIGRDEAD